MALWYDVGAGMSKISFASRTMDRTAFLCASGPSLGQINTNYLQGPNRTVFALNNTYPSVRPDVWVGMDDPTCYSRELFSEPFIKVLRGGYQNRSIESGSVARGFNTYYADCSKPKDRSDLFKLRKHDVRFVWHNNTMMLAMHLIVWMGYNRIYLLGVDLDNTKQAYHGGVKVDSLTEKKRKDTQRLYDEIHQWLRWFSVEGQHHGIKTISCSPDSRINEYLDYRSYLDVIEERESMIDRGQPLYHPTDVEERLKKAKKEGEQERKKNIKSKPNPKQKAKPEQKTKPEQNAEPVMNIKGNKQNKAQKNKQRKKAA